MAVRREKELANACEMREIVRVNSKSPKCPQNSFKIRVNLGFSC